MIALAGWAALTLGGAAAGWLAGAFVLRWGGGGRCGAAAGFAYVVMLGALLSTIIGEDWPANDAAWRWRLVLVLFGALLSTFAVLPAMGIWLLMEARLGDRARRP